MNENLTATPAMYLALHKANKNNLFPVCLRVTYMRESVYYRMKYPKKLPNDLKGNEGKTIVLSEDDFSKVYKKNPKNGHAALKKIFDTFIENASDIISKMQPFTFDDFKNKYFHQSDENDLFAQLKKRAEELRVEGRITTAVCYESTLKSLQNFQSKPSLNFDEVNVSFLNRYQKWMIEEGNSRTTIGMYLRNVRTLFNASNIEGLIYPFGKKGGLYNIPTGSNTKKALTIDQVAQIAAFKALPGTWEDRSRDYWLFSYLGNGINMRDVARLKYSNIQDDVITFVRAKTAASSEKEIKIEIIITEQIGRILDKWGNKPASPDEYIFPIFKNGMTPQDQYRACQQTIANINHNMNRIAKIIGIEGNLTTYVARHSFATVLKNSGASVGFIQEALGHTSPQTTQSYLAAFDTDKKREYAGKLLPKNL
jgi:integrase